MTILKKKGRLLAGILCIGMLFLSACEKSEVILGPVADTEAGAQGNTEAAAMSENGDSSLMQISCDEQDFATRVPQGCVTGFQEEDGLYIWTETKDSIPYVLVYSHDGEADAKAALEEYADTREDKYGENLINCDGVKTYSVGGKQLPGVQTVYMVDGYVIESLRVLDASDGYTVSYIAKYIQGEEDRTMDTMEAAVQNMTHTFAAVVSDDDKENTVMEDVKEKTSTDSAGKTTRAAENVTITPTAAAGKKLVSYNDGWLSMKMPEGWSASNTMNTAEIGIYTVRLYDPAVPDRQIFVGLSTSWFESEKVYQSMANYPGYGAFYKAFPYLSGNNDAYDAGFYLNFNTLALGGFGEKMTLAPMYDFNILEEMGKTPLGGTIYRGTYKNAKGEEIQGVFTAQWQKPLAMGVGAFYTTIFFSTPTGEFAEWEEMLNSCVAAIQYTDKFESSYYEVADNTMKAAMEAAKTYDQISDIITSGWEERNTTYDVISQKTSDATLGYERVYDSETGEYYKADLGFGDWYDGSRYVVTDSDSAYLAPVSGYITFQ